MRALVVVAWSAWACALPAAPIPLETFARVPDFRAPAISDDGSQIAYVKDEEGKSVVVLFEFASKKARGVLPGAAEKYAVKDCTFKGSTRLVCRYRGVDFWLGKPFPTSRLIAVDTDGSDAKVLVQRSRGGVSQFQDNVLHWLPGDERRVLIQLDDDGDAYPSVFRLDVFDGTLGEVQREREPITHWLADGYGVLRFGYGVRGVTDRPVYLARSRADEPWSTLEKFKRFERGRLLPLGFASQSNVMLVAAPNNGRSAIWEWDLREKNDFQLRYARPDVDVDEPVVWTRWRRIVGFEYQTDKPQLELFDSEAARIQKSVDAVLPHTINRVVSASGDLKKLVVLARSDTEPGQYSLLNLNTRTLEPIGRENGALDRKQLAPTKPTVIPGLSGLKVPGYLTLPAGKSARLPLVVLVHDGPLARDGWTYDPVVQLLANRGFAVLQLNFRGSTGYGETWLDAGFGLWGSVIHDDLTTATRALISQGVADPRKVCIVGRGYGGYSAVMGVVKEPQLYQCAVSLAGVSDLTRMQVDDERYPGIRQLPRDPESLTPLRNADRIKVPVLLVHGENDTEVPSDHSKNLARALKDAGVPHDLVLIEDGDHDLARTQWRVTLYSKLEGFLKSQLGL